MWIATFTTGEACTRSNRVGTEEVCEVWKDYQEKIKPIVVWIKSTRNLEREQMSWTKGLETLIKTMEKKYSQEEKGIV